MKYWIFLIGEHVLFSLDYFPVISREIIPLPALYPPPPYKKVLYSGRRGRYAQAYGICAPFYSIGLK